MATALFASVRESAGCNAVQALSREHRAGGRAHRQEPARRRELRLRGGRQQRPRDAARAGPAGRARDDAEHALGRRSCPRPAAIAHDAGALVAERAGVAEREVDRAAAEERAETRRVAVEVQQRPRRARRPRAPTPARRGRARTDCRCRGSAPRRRARAASRAARRARRRGARRARAGSSAAASPKTERRASSSCGLHRYGTARRPPLGVADGIAQAARRRRRGRSRPAPRSARDGPRRSAAPASSPRSSTRSTPGPGSSPAASGGTICTLAAGTRRDARRARLARERRRPGRQPHRRAGGRARRAPAGRRRRASATAAASRDQTSDRQPSRMSRPACRSSSVTTSGTRMRTTFE